MLNRVCVFSIRDDDDHSRFNGKLRGFIKFVSVFLFATITASFLISAGSPFLGSEKDLFINIAFPLDYKNSEVAFWIAFVFLFTECFLSTPIVLFSIVMWYLLLTCSFRYEVLGGELKNMGQTSEKGSGKMAERQRHNTFFKDLKALIDAHLYLRECVTFALTDDVGSLFSKIFLFTFGTSGVCICGSIYCLAFDMGDSHMERLAYLLLFLYFIADLFMNTYFGNEIKLSSDHFSYSLFGSDWYNQLQSTQKCNIIFGEYLKQPQVLRIGKLYLLTLETFMRILNSAYSMFNILKSFQ